MTLLPDARQVITGKYKKLFGSNSHIGGINVSKVLEKTFKLCTESFERNDPTFIHCRLIKRIFLTSQHQQEESSQKTIALMLYPSNHFILNDH